MSRVFADYRLRQPKHQRIKSNSNYRDIKQSFLIICEGVNTEPDYFNAFRLTSASVKALGKGLNTIKLVQEALIVRNEERRKGHNFDQYWVVFDKDDFSNHDFNEAIRLAESNGFQVAYSNQAFEYWFLLHFNIYRGYIHRNDYEQMLSQQMKVKYSKKDNFTTKIYGMLLPYQPEAISRARKILAEFGSTPPSQAVSSTTVFRLVEELNRFISENQGVLWFWHGRFIKHFYVKSQNGGRFSGEDDNKCKKKCTFDVQNTDERIETLSQMRGKSQKRLTLLSDWTNIQFNSMKFNSMKL